MTPGHLLIPVEQPEVQPVVASSPTGHRTWNRFELKYLFPVRRLAELRAAMGPYVTADPNAGANGYRVHSVYWDSPRFRFFWEKIDGEKIRRKVRFRTYGEGSEVFIEIKQRIDRTVQKRRVIWPADRVNERFGMNRSDYEQPETDENPVVSEVLCLCHQYNLRPVMAVSYRRQALFGVYEPELRITFDTRVQFSANELRVDRPFEVGRYMVDPRMAIMEIKFNHHVPMWLIRLVEQFQLSVIRFSKYCTAVDIAHYGRQFT